MGEATGNSAFDEGVRLFGEGKPNEAVPHLKSVVELDPSNAKAHAYLGAAYSQLRQHDAAVNEFTQLTSLEPDNPSHSFNLGRAYEAWGKEAEALTAYRKALSVNPHYDKAQAAINALSAKGAGAAASTGPQAQRPAAAPTPPADVQEPTPWAAGAPSAPGVQPGMNPNRPGQQSPFGTYQGPQASRYPGRAPVTYSRDVVPPEIAGKLNIGAFLLSPFWSIAHRVWIGLLVFVPYVGWIMSLVLLIKGNDWGWKNRDFSSVDEFKAVQSAWLKWGIGLLIASIVLGIICAIALVPVFMKASQMQHMPTNPGIPNPGIPAKPGF